MHFRVCAVCVDACVPFLLTFCVDFLSFFLFFSFREDVLYLTFSRRTVWCNLISFDISVALVIKMVLVFVCVFRRICGRLHSLLELRYLKFLQVLL